MFCRKCGKEIPDDSGFCPACGTPVTKESSLIVNDNSLSTTGITTSAHNNSSIQSTQATPEVISSLERLLEPLKKISELPRKDFQKIIDDDEKFLSEQKGYYLLIGIPFIILIIASIIMGDSSFILAKITGILLLLLFIISIYKNYELKKTREEQETYITSMNEICSTIDASDLSILPPSYRFYDAAFFIYNAFINQRALTMQQGVNLYEDEISRNKAARIQQENMQIIQKQLSSIKRNTKVSATMSTLNYLDKFFS